MVLTPAERQSLARLVRLLRAKAADRSCTPEEQRSFYAKVAELELKLKGGAFVPPPRPAPSPPRRAPEVVDVRAAVRAETERAWKLWDGKTEGWVPKSAGQDNRDGTFTIATWVAEEKGFV